MVNKDFHRQRYCTFSRCRTIPEVVITQRIAVKCCIIVFERGKVNGSRQKNGGRRLIHCESQDVG